MGVGEGKGWFVHEVIRQLYHYLLDEATVQSLQGEGCIPVVLRNFLIINLVELVVKHDSLCLAARKQFVVLLQLSSANGPFVFDDIKVDLLDLDVMFLNGEAFTKERLR